MRCIVDNYNIAWFQIVSHTKYHVLYSLKDPKLVYSRSFEMNQQQNYRGQVFISDGWEVCLYMIILSPFVICRVGRICVQIDWPPPPENTNSTLVHLARYLKLPTLQHGVMNLQCCIIATSELVVMARWLYRSTKNIEMKRRQWILHFAFMIISDDLNLFLRIKFLWRQSQKHSNLTILDVVCVRLSNGRISNGKWH